MRIKLQSMKSRSHQTVKKSEIAKKTRNICNVFRKSAAALIGFRILRYQGDLRAVLFRLNAIEFCFRFSTEGCGAYFCPIWIEGGALLSTKGLDSIWRFYNICSLYYIWGHHYICGPFLLHLRVFVVNYYICGFNRCLAWTHIIGLVQIINSALFGGRYFLLHVINLYHLTNSMMIDRRYQYVCVFHLCLGLHAEAKTAIFHVMWLNVI